MIDREHRVHLSLLTSCSLFEIHADLKSNGLEHNFNNRAYPLSVYLLNPIAPAAYDQIAFMILFPMFSALVSACASSASL